MSTRHAIDPERRRAAIKESRGLRVALDVIMACEEIEMNTALAICDEIIARYVENDNQNDR